MKFKVGDRITWFFNFLYTGTIIEIIDNSHIYVKWDDTYDEVNIFCHTGDLVFKNECADFSFEPGDRVCWLYPIELPDNGTVISMGLEGNSNMERVYHVEWDDRPDIVKFQHESCLIFISHDGFQDKIKDRLDGF